MAAIDHQKDLLTSKQQAALTPTTLRSLAAY